MSTLHLLRLPTSAFCLTDMTLRTPRVPFLENKIRYESKTSPFERYFWEKIQSEERNVLNGRKYRFEIASERSKFMSLR